MEPNIYDRIKSICDDRNIKMQHLMNECGIHISTAKGWKLGQSPSADKLLRIANALKVSVDYLVGNADIKETADELIGDTDIISIQRARSNMPDSDKERMMATLKAAFDYAFAKDKKD